MVVRDIHKLLKSVFHQAVKWQLMDRNPAEGVDLPKYKSKEREVWSPETMMYANQVCKDEKLKLAINLTFAGSLRIGEALGLPGTAWISVMKPSLVSFPTLR